MFTEELIGDQKLTAVLLNVHAWSVVLPSNSLLLQLLNRIPFPRFHPSYLINPFSEHSLNKNSGAASS